MVEKTNLTRLRASRAPVSRGDVFVMQVLRAEYLFGLVVLADLPRERAPMPGANLIYVYNKRSNHLKPPTLSPNDLLIPPTFTNRLPWSKGYFQTVAHRDLKPNDLLARHCFRRWTGEYLDENGKRLAGESAQCGDWALTGYLMLDDMISAALGIAPADQHEDSHS